MNDTPEHVAVRWGEAGDVRVTTWEYQHTDQTEDYVRKDIYDAVVAERDAALARIEELEAVMDELDVAEGWIEALKENADD